jgi:predicted RNase H-like nuclease (RuvC/YqgF family)
LLDWEEELRGEKQLAALRETPKEFLPKGHEGDSKVEADYIPYDQSLKQLKRLSVEVESLKKKCLDKDAEISRLRGRLERYEELSEVLSGTGVLPR